MKTPRIVPESGRLHGHASNGKGIPAHPTRQIVINRPALKERADASNHNERTDDECPNGLPEGEASAHLNGFAIPVKPAVSIDLQQIDPSIEIDRNFPGCELDRPLCAGILFNSSSRFVSVMTGQAYRHSLKKYGGSTSAPGPTLP